MINKRIISFLSLQDEYKHVLYMNLYSLKFTKSNAGDTKSVYVCAESIFFLPNCYLFGHFLPSSNCSKTFQFYKLTLMCAYQEK